MSLQNNVNLQSIEINSKLSRYGLRSQKDNTISNAVHDALGLMGMNSARGK